MSRADIRVTGFGGQGVILAAHIIGRACAVEAGRHASMLQSFGPEARGSACSATLAVSDGEILYPYVGRTDILVVMSGEGYQIHSPDLKDDGVLIYEKDLVKPDPKPGQRAYGVSSTRIAEEQGRTIVQNIVMVGFFAATTRLVPGESMREAVKSSVPAGTEELNLRAFEAGWAAFETDYGETRSGESGIRTEQI